MRVSAFIIRCVFAHSSFILFSFLFISIQNSLIYSQLKTKTTPREKRFSCSRARASAFYGCCVCVCSLRFSLGSFGWLCFLLFVAPPYNCVYVCCVLIFAIGKRKENRQQKKTKKASVSRQPHHAEASILRRLCHRFRSRCPRRPLRSLSRVRPDLREPR